MPSRETIRRIVTEVISVEQLEKRFSAFLAQLTPDDTPVIVSVDGKTLRGSRQPMHPHEMHLLAAYLPTQGIVLFQMAVERKENEIPVAHRLSKHLDLRAKIVTGDALLTPRTLCHQIVKHGGDYVFKVKENQP